MKLFGTSMMTSVLSLVGLGIPGAPALAQVSGNDEDGIGAALSPKQSERAGDEATDSGVMGPEADTRQSPPDIVVTGSRIPRPNLDSSVPVTSLDAATLTSSGNVSLGDALAKLPPLRPTYTQANSTRFIGTAGLNLLDLRGLQFTRTLVLVNGRRHVTAVAGSYSVDVNTIPTDLVERVDIITGGNSALYGSDAIAGVVNFVLKRDFEGLRVRAQSGVSSHGDRASRLVSLTAGHNFAGGRGNVAIELEFDNQDAVYYRDRDDFTGAYSGFNQYVPAQDTFDETEEGDGIPDNFLLRHGRSNGAAEGGLYTSVCPTSPPANATAQQLAAFNARRAVNCSGIIGNTGRELGRTFIFDSSGRLTANECTQDLRPLAGFAYCIGGRGTTTLLTGQLVPGLERKAANVLASFEVSTAFRPFLEAKYVRIDAIQESQPTFLGGVLPNSYRLDNPFLTDQARALLQTSLAPGATTFVAQRFNVDLGGRGEVHNRETMRLVVGAEGTFNEDWRYEVALDYGRFRTHYDTRNNIHLQRFRNAVDATRNGRGEIVCRINADTNPANDDPACAPLDLFGEHRASPAAINYISQASYRNETAEQFDATAYVAGDSSQLFQLPGGPVSFVLGAEYRRETAYSAFDPVVSNPVRQTFLPASAPFAPPPLAVEEGFGELRLPILRDASFAHELTVEAAGRVSHNSQGARGAVFTYNVGGIYAPVRDIRFRVSYARAVRAPTSADLFSPTVDALERIFDPCSAESIGDNPNRAKNCAAAGVPATEIIDGEVVPFTNIPSTTISGSNRGNPGLASESSKSLTVGFVAQPRFLPGLTFSADYYRINVRNVIAALSGQAVINECYDDPAGINNPYCAAVFRRTDGTFRGQFNRIVGGDIIQYPSTGPGADFGPSFFSQPFNYARMISSGIDADLGYRTQLDRDIALNLRLVVGWLGTRNVYTSITSPEFGNRRKGELGDPEWAGQFWAGLDLAGVSFGYNLRWVGRQTVAPEYEAQNSFQGFPPFDPDSFPQVWFPDVFYHNFRVDLAPAKSFRFYAGVDNIFDTYPPAGVPLNGGGPYENIGRFFYAGAEFKF